MPCPVIEGIEGRAVDQFRLEKHIREFCGETLVDALTLDADEARELISKILLERDRPL